MNYVPCETPTNYKTYKQRQIHMILCEIYLTIQGSKITNLKLRHNQIRTQLSFRGVIGFTPGREGQGLNNRQENTTSPGRGTRHCRSNKCLAYCQPIRQTQCAFPQPLHKISGNPIPQAGLHEPTSEEEGNNNQPDHLIGESTKRRRKGQSSGDNGGCEAEKGPSADGQWAQNQAGNGG